jgi:hypothetical protein
MLIAYTASVVLVLSASAVLLEILIRRSGAVPVPHPLFYAISVTLPYQWRSGLLLAPSVVLIAGLLARTTTHVNAQVIEKPSAPAPQWR